MEDLWAKITSMPRPYRIVDFPRRDSEGNPIGELAIWVLTQEEQMACAGNAERTTRKVLKDVPKDNEAKRGYDDTYNNAGACEVLHLACRNKDDVEKPFFPNSEAVRKLSVDEIGALMMHYYTTQSELGPIVSRMSDEEVDAWLDKIQKAGSRYPLDLISWEALKDLAYILALRSINSLTSNISLGLPLSENTLSDSSQAQ